MAKKLKTYEFKNTRRSKYPWEEWTDGSIWEVKSGEDFSSKVESFRSMLASQASSRGFGVHTSVPAEGVVVFQFFKK